MRQQSRARILAGLKRPTPPPSERSPQARIALRAGAPRVNVDPNKSEAARSRGRKSDLNDSINE